MTTTETTKPMQHKRRSALMGVGIVFAIIAIIYAIYWFIWGRFELYTDDAYVHGNIVQIMPQITGTVIAIHTDDTALVVHGQPLVMLDKTDTAIALEHAKAALAETVRQVREYYENAARAENMLTLRQADLVKAELDFKRRQGLVHATAISREEMQHYATALAGAKMEYNIAENNLRTAFALVDNTHLYTHPLVERAKAELRMAYLNYQRTVINAPVTGYVANRTVELGQTVNTTVPLLSIIPLNQIWVEANYKENQLANIRIGQAVTLKADAYPGIIYHGHVVGLTPGTGPIFSLLPPQNATGNWIKILQRLPVRISLSTEEIKQHPLLLGLSMKVTTNIQDTSGKRLASLQEPSILYATQTYDSQLIGMQALINTILHDNGPDVTFHAATTLAKVAA